MSLLRCSQAFFLIPPGGSQTEIKITERRARGGFAEDRREIQWYCFHRWLLRETFRPAKRHECPGQCVALSIYNCSIFAQKVQFSTAEICISARTRCPHPNIRQTFCLSVNNRFGDFFRCRIINHIPHNRQTELNCRSQAPAGDNVPVADDRIV